MERRTAVVAKELAAHNIDIAAISESRLADEGQLTEHGSGYTFFWKGQPSSDGGVRNHGVCFAVHSKILAGLEEFPCGINERLMTLRVPLKGSRFATLISAYAPTLDADGETKELFYENLDKILISIPKEDKLILLGDFNARVGSAHYLWPGTLGRNGLGSINSNGTLLLSKCSQHSLIITNTLFRQPNKLKGTWRHPRSKHWHLIDYVIVRRCDVRDVMITRAVVGSDHCDTDHRLVISKMYLSVTLKRRKKGSTATKKINVNALSKDEVQHDLEANLRASMPHARDPAFTSLGAEDHWAEVKLKLSRVCQETIGTAKRKHQDWFDENDATLEELISRKRTAFLDRQRDPTCPEKNQIFKDVKAEVQRKTRALKNEWWTTKAEEIEGFAKCHKLYEFYKSIKSVYGPRSSGPPAVRSLDGSLIKSKKEALLRWKEHYHTLLNRQTNPHWEAIAGLPQLPEVDVLDQVPSYSEVEKAVKQLKAKKAPGEDGIPAEVYKLCDPHVLDHLLAVFEKIWEEEVVPQDLKDATIVNIYKNKGDRTVCGNYRGISLLSIAGKILSRILLNRLLPVAESFLPESQCGFRPSRGTGDMIFVARQLQEKAREQNCDLHMVFIDLTKAFDSVNREALWAVLRKFGCPAKFVEIVKQLHLDMNGKINHEGDVSEIFPIKTGVKQGCVLAPTLFSIFLGAFLSKASLGLSDGVHMEYRIGGLLNIRRFEAKSKVSMCVVRELQYADDLTLIAHSQEDLQVSLDAYVEAYTAFGLEVNVGKTQVLSQLSSPLSNVANVSIHGQPLENVNAFKYLGSTLSVSANIDCEVERRVDAASKAYGRLRARVFDSHELSTGTKLSVYRAVVVPTLLYSSESWVTYSYHLRKLETFHQRCLRSILGISWRDRQRNEDVLTQAGCRSITELVADAHLRWLGHVNRLDDHRLPKQVLFGQLNDRPRKPGGPRKRLKDCLKVTMKACGVDIKSWESSSKDRGTWRSTIQAGTRAARKEKLNRRGNPSMNRRGNPSKKAISSVTSVYTCTMCNRVCTSRIGMHAHERWHKKTVILDPE